MDSLPSITIIIPHRENESIEEGLKAIERFDYDHSKIEIISVSGNHPSIQRNACIKKAKGDIIYFLDNDSYVDVNNLKLAVTLFNSDDNIAVVGGPNVSKDGDSPIQKDFAYCLSSIFAVGPVKNRYAANGKVRKASDRDLILCNLFIRKNVLLDVGIFNENLYPNEENELIDRIRKAGHFIYYHPEIIVYRSPRPNRIAFIKMLLNYGQGRFTQIVEDFSIKNTIFLTPAFFTIYIIFAPFIISYFALNDFREYIFIYLSPFAFYSLLNISFSILSLSKLKNKSRAITSIPILYFFVHFFYGSGILIGMIKNLFAGKKEKVVYKIHLEKEMD